MHFRDEPEGILGTTPGERRTPMVSAAFAREVFFLAKRHENDAISVQGSALTKLLPVIPEVDLGELNVCPAVPMHSRVDRFLDH